MEKLGLRAKLKNITEYNHKVVGSRRENNFGYANI